MTGSRRVLLVNPVPLYGGESTAAASALQPALLSIASYLAGHSVPVEVLDLHLELGSPATLDEVEPIARSSADRVLARDHDLLAISCNSSYHYLGALDLARRVRARDDDLPIVVGGAHASVASQDFTGDVTPFDVVVRGDGEVELAELAREPVVRRPTAQVRDGRPLPLDRVWLDLEGYPYWRTGVHRVSFPLSRGCPFGCTFCAGAERGRWRAYPVPVALAVARTLLESGAGVVAFTDALFGLHAAWRHEFLDGLAALAPQAAIELEMRVETLDDSDLARLAQLDVQVDIGLETASPRMVEVMNKAPEGSRYLARARRVIDGLARHEIVTKLNLVLNHPGEDDESLEATLAFVRALPELHPRAAVYATRHSFLYLPGTAVARDREWWEQSTGSVIEHPLWWKEERLQHDLADAVRTAASPVNLEAALGELLELRAAAVKAMRAPAKLTWRRIRAPLRLPKEVGGLGATSS